MFYLQKNKWLSKIKIWLDENDPYAVCIPFSGTLELKLMEMPEDERLIFLKEQNTTRCDSLMIFQIKSSKLICTVVFYTSFFPLPICVY